MTSTLTLHFYIENIIEEYENIIIESKDEKIREKFTHYIEALKNLDKKISMDWDFNSSGLMETILTENNNLYDTELTFYDDKTIVISKDVVAMIKGNFICILGNEEEFNNSLKENGFPVILEAIDIDTIKNVSTIKE
jgi:hypothetical protein